MLPVIKSDHQLVHTKIPTRPATVAIKGKSHSLTYGGQGPHLSIRQYNRSKSVSVAVVHSQVVKSRSPARKFTTSSQDTLTTTSIEMTARSRNTSSPPEPLKTRRQRSSSRVSFTCIGINSSDSAKENQQDGAKLQPPRRASVAAVPRKKSFTQFLSFFKLSRVPSVESDVEDR